MVKVVDCKSIGSSSVGSNPTSPSLEGGSFPVA